MYSVGGLNKSNGSHFADTETILLSAKVTRPFSSIAAMNKARAVFWFKGCVFVAGGTATSLDVQINVKFTVLSRVNGLKPWV